MRIHHVNREQLYVELIIRLNTFTTFVVARTTGVVAVSPPPICRNAYYYFIETLFVTVRYYLPMSFMSRVYSD